MPERFRKLRSIGRGTKPELYGAPSLEIVASIADSSHLIWSDGRNNKTERFQEAGARLKAHITPFVFDPSLYREGSPISGNTLMRCVELLGQFVPKDFSNNQEKQMGEFKKTDTHRVIVTLLKGMVQNKVPSNFVAAIDGDNPNYKKLMRDNIPIITSLPKNYFREIQDEVGLSPLRTFAERYKPLERPSRPAPEPVSVQ